MILVLSGSDFTAFASQATETGTKEPAIEASAEAEENTDAAVAADGSADAAEAAEEFPAFEQTAVTDGVKITVTADEGVFPGDAKLSARKVYYGEKSRVESTVESVRGDGVNVAASYTFDIKVLNEDGEELEPDTSKGSVRVSFAMSEADNQNLNAEVYHINDDMNVEKLSAGTTTEGGEPAVVAETDGFSYYTVEFTYGQMQYVMEGDTTVPLQDILDYALPVITGNA